MCVLIFSTDSVRNVSHSEDKLVRFDQKCALAFMQSTRYSCHILMKPEFSRQIFEKKSTQILNLIKIRPVGAKTYHADGRRGRQS
jgi:hypothetical protein